jgi:hypothetical protein
MNNQIQPPVSQSSNITKALIFILLVIIITSASLSIGFLIGSKQISNKSLILTATNISTDKTSDWKTYKSSISPENIFSGNDYEFKLPQDWSQIEKSSNFEQRVTFKSRDNVLFGVDIVKNPNVITHKPYKSIDEYINMSYTVKVLRVAGLDARQPLPRAGSENVYEVNFFTSNAEFIFSLSLEFPKSVKEKTPLVRQQLFEQILSTFKTIK